MAGYQTENFKIGACSVNFRGNYLGATRDGVKINVSANTYDVRCDQSYGCPVRSIITGIKVTISILMLEVDKGFALMLDSNGRLTESIIGTDLFEHGGPLLLTPDNSGDHAGYRFPAATPEPDFNYTFSSTENHILVLKFTANADADGVFMEKLTVN